MFSCIFSGSLTETVLRHVGFVGLEDIDILSGTLWLAPDILMLVGSSAVYLAIKKTIGAIDTNPLSPTSTPPLVTFFTAKSKYLM